MRECECGAPAANKPGEEPKCWFHMALASLAEQAMPLPVLRSHVASTAFVAEDE